MAKIFSLSDISRNSDDNKIKKYLQEIREIFFASSSVKTFSSEEKKENFFKKWCGDYKTYYPDEFFLLMEDDRVLGYLSGVMNSSFLIFKIETPGFLVFEDLFEKFPAHFHINLHPDERGRGAGSILVEYYFDFLRSKKIKGVHIVTSPDAKNIYFYKKLLFSFVDTREYNQRELLFMGRSLE